MPKIPGSAVWVDGGSFAELENVGGRAGSRRGAVDGFGFGLAELDSHCLIHEKVFPCKNEQQNGDWKRLYPALRNSAQGCVRSLSKPGQQERWILEQEDTPERGGW